MSDTVNCPLCGESTDHVLTCVLRRGEGTVFHCKPCDLGFLISNPVDAKEYYGNQYRERVSHHAQPATTNPHEIFEVYSRYQTDRLKLVLPHLKGDSNVLEIGAGAGQFLSHLDGKCARRCAIELDSKCCWFMRDNLGIEISSDYLKDSRFYNEKFDIVCAFQTLEHVPDPVALLEDVRAVMKPGGMAFIEVPNLNDHLLSVWNIKEYRNFYYHADHLFYFSGKALIKAAEKAGFVNPRVSYLQDYTLINTLYWITMKAPQPTCHIGLSPIEASLGRNRDVLAVWLADTLTKINQLYVNGLEARGATSNLMLLLHKN